MRRFGYQNYRILLIDDDPAILDTLELALMAQGFEVAKSESGESGIQEAKAQKFALAITDLKMPGMDGVQTLKALRQIDPTFPVIIITGFASDATAKECANEGAFGFVRKPFQLDLLYRLVEKAIESRDVGAA